MHVLYLDGYGDKGQKCILWKIKVATLEKIKDLT